MSLLQRYRKMVVATTTTTFIGLNYALSKRRENIDAPRHVLPSGFPRACCCDNTALFTSRHASAHCEASSIPPSSSSTSSSSSSFSFSAAAFTSTTNTATTSILASSSSSPSTFNSDLVTKLRGIVGHDHVYPAGDSAQSVYLKGARLGQGSAVAVCRPATLQQAVDSLRAIVSAGAIVIPQGANTGLTGGSVPRDETNRTAVVLNMRRLNQIYELDADVTTDDLSIEQENSHLKMLCMAGAGIHDLAERAKQLHRESHSILGSTFLNPTVAAGLSLGSGGSQMRKGPVFTERALWCSVEEDGSVQLHNTLGFGDELLLRGENELLHAVGAGDLCALLSTASTIPVPPPASDAIQYCQSICNVEDGKVSRFNADTRGIDPVRSEGKVLILASVHDTFPVPKSTRNVWISVDSLSTAQQLKQQVVLDNPNDLPVSCEYMNGDTINVVDEGGRALCHSLLTFGIGPKFEMLWDVKMKIESFGIFSDVPDQMLSIVNNILPSCLPFSVMKQTKQYQHHMLLTVGDFGTGEIDRFEERLEKFIKSRTSSVGIKAKNQDQDQDHDQHDVAVLTLNNEEAQQVGIFRFAAAPAFRTWCVGRSLQGLSLDYALPKNHITVPAVEGGVHVAQPVVRCRYSHFGCNVVHEDIAYEAGVDVLANKMAIKHVVEEEGGKLPAEHGHGTEYTAPKDTQDRWKKMDPRNVFNPGVGGTDDSKFYGKR